MHLPALELWPCQQSHQLHKHQRTTCPFHWQTPECTFGMKDASYLYCMMRFVCRLRQYAAGVQQQQQAAVGAPTGAHEGAEGAGPHTHR